MAIMNIDTSTILDEVFTTEIDLNYTKYDWECMERAFSYTDIDFTPCYFMPPPVPVGPSKFNDTATLRDIVKYGSAYSSISKGKILKSGFKKFTGKVSDRPTPDDRKR